jgi:microcystin-dependent protein
MASTSSPNLKLELIGTGEQQGTWGSTTNTNLGTLLEEAIGGYAALAMADADQTLTMTPYAAATARNMTIEFTGALTAARTVSLSAALEKVYIVKNSTTGGFAVTFKVTGQTGVSVPSGATYVLYVDGTDARQATGSVVSGGTGTTTSTGTGSVVLSASPTFTGTPLSTTAAADTDTTQVATTAYVIGQASSTAPVIDGVATVGASLRYARADHIHPTDTSRAPLNSPSLTGTPLAPTATGGTSTTQIATTAFVQTAIGASVPSGVVSPYAGSTAPSGWLLCSGDAVSRSTYAALFAIVGTTYGVGDGSTTFNIPDLRGRAVAGVDNMGGTAANRITSGGSGIVGTTLGAAGGLQTHTLATTEIPAHTHFVSSIDSVVNTPTLSATNALAKVRSDTNNSPNYNLTGSPTDLATIGLSSVTGGGGAHNNTQPTLMLNYIIKT